MKPANEIFQTVGVLIEFGPGRPFYEGFRAFNEHDIKAIQGEAFKAGLDAAHALVTIDGNPEVAKDAIARLRDRIP